MLLAGDIGGTKTTLALFTPEGGLEPSVQTSFKSKEYPSLAAVAAQFLGEAGASVDRAVFGVAGPVTRWAGQGDQPALGHNGGGPARRLGRA